MRLGGQRAGWAIYTRNNRGIGLVVLRVVVFGVVQGERRGVDDVRLVVTGQRVRAVERLWLAIQIVVFSGSLKLLYCTRLRDYRKVHVLVSSQVGTAVLRPREVDVAGRFVDTQVLSTTGCLRVRGADKFAVAVVGLHDHTGHRVIRTLAAHSRDVDLTDLGFALGSRDDDVLFEVLPRHRDRVTFDVLARPGVHDGRKGCAASLGGSWSLRIVLLIVALPGVTYRVSGCGLSELLDFRIGQFCAKVQVSLLPTTINYEDFVGLVSDNLVNKGLTGIHRGNWSRIEVLPH